MLSRLANGESLGFSLVELVVGIAILAVLSSLALPSYTAWIQNTRIRNAAESIQNGMQIARAEAVKRNAAVQFDLRGTDSAWTVCVRPATPGSCPSTDDATTLQSRQNKEGSSADITVDASDGTPLVFNSFGALISPAPAAADGLVRIAVDIDSSVLSAEESRDLVIIIGVGGSIRMCDPALDPEGTDPRRCPE